MKNGAWGYSGNPFGDDECGKFYGRSLSVWSALLALQGFEYDGPAGRIGFRPILNAEKLAGKSVETRLEMKGNDLSLAFHRPLVLPADQRLEIEIKFA